MLGNTMGTTIDHNIIKDENACLVEPVALAHHLNHCTTCKIQNGRQGSKNGRQGLGFWAIHSTFFKLVFDLSTPSMRRVDDGEEEKRKKEKIMSFIVATNVIASRPPDRRPTGTPHARANCQIPSGQKTSFR